MSDSDQGGSYVEVTERSWLGRLAGSFMAAIFGLVLFFASFVVLYWNEGRAVEAITSLGAGARNAVTVISDKLDPANQGKLVYLTGTATVAGPPVDSLFKLAPADAIRLRRHVEMYQWREHEETRTERRTGGGETTVKTYSYNREWSDSAIDSGKFKQPGGHGNPAMNVRNTDFAAQTTRIGAYQIDRALVGELGGLKPLADILPLVLARLGVGALQSVGETREPN